MNEKKNHRTGLLLKCGMVFFSLTLLLSTALFVVDRWERGFGADTNDIDLLAEEITYNGQEYRLKEGVETLLVMGLDAFDNQEDDGYRNNQQADFLMLLALDSQDNSCKVIQINRDTMAQMDVLGVTGDKVDTTTAQIALSHTYGNGREISCRNTANAVSDLLGVNVRHYVAVSMDAVGAFNDLVGGVSVEVMDDFTSLDSQLVKGETVTLNADQALLYVRTRQGLEDASNQRRMERQKQYLKALMKTAGQKADEDESFWMTALEQLKDRWVSDCSAKDLKATLNRYGVEEPEEYFTIEGTTEMGEQFVEFYPDEDSLMQVVLECFYEPVK